MIRGKKGREGERIDCEGGKGYNVVGARDREGGRVGLRGKRQKNGKSGNNSQSNRLKKNGFRIGQASVERYRTQTLCTSNKIF